MVGDRKIDQKYCDVKKAKAGKQKKLRNNPKNETAQGTSFKQTQSARKEVICHCCDEKGLYSNKCPKKGDIAPNKWAIKTGAIKTGTTNLQQNGGNLNGNNNPNDGGWSWNGLQHNVKSNVEEFTSSQQSDTVNYNFLRDMIILDSGSTIKTTFMNPKFLTNIRKSSTQL